jgi:phospholipid transport system substrate-binding protein
MMLFLKKLWLVVGLTLSLSSVAMAEAPDEMLRRTTDQVLQMVRQDKDIQSGDRQKTYALIEEKIVPHFDFARMTRLAVGKNWNKASEDQQKALVDAFRNLLVRTYSSAISRFRNQVINYKPWTGKADDTTTTVQCVVTDNSHSVPLDYTLARGESGWRIYDIKVDGISLVTNYRSDFNDRISAGGIDGLIKDLQDKARTLDTASNRKSS